MAPCTPRPTRHLGGGDPRRAAGRSAASDGDVDAWKNLPVKTTSRLVRDLLTLTKDVDSFGWYPVGSKLVALRCSWALRTAPSSSCARAQDLTWEGFVEILKQLAD